MSLPDVFVYLFAAGRVQVIVNLFVWVCVRVLLLCLALRHWFHSVSDQTPVPDSTGMFLLICWQCFGYLLAKFSQCFGNVLVMFWQCVGNVLAMFWQCLGNVLAMFRQGLDSV